MKWPRWECGALPLASASSACHAAARRCSAGSGSTRAGATAGGWRGGRQGQAAHRSGVAGEVGRQPVECRGARRARSAGNGELAGLGIEQAQPLRDHAEHVDIHPDDGTYDYSQLLDPEHPERLKLFQIPTRVVC